MSIGGPMFSAKSRSFLWAIACLWLPLTLAAQKASLRPDALTCEYRVDPQGIGAVQPRLAWKLLASDDHARGLRQTAYQVLVASSPEGLAANRADLWDSGRVESDATNQIVFGGAPLASRARCWWKVRVWDQEGKVSAWSRPAAWSLGLLAKSDWSAEWIGADAVRPTDGSVLSPEQEARLRAAAWQVFPANATAREVWVRREFTLGPGTSIEKATLALVPYQRAEVRVNGQIVARLAGWDRAVPVDITAALREGGNVVALHLTHDDGNPVALLGELELTFAGGERQRMPLDATWRATATAPASGWDVPGPVDPAGWSTLAALEKRKSPWGSPQKATHFLPPPPFLRKAFTLGKPVRRATLYATALGVYELQLNGERVGRDVLAPGWTDYRRRVQHQTYDVTTQLRNGGNALGAILGDGWFAGPLAHLENYHYNGYPRLLAQLEVEFADGTREVIGTDASWRAAHGPIRHADIFQGYAADARTLWPGWSRTGFDDAAWQPVQAGLRSVDAAKPMATDFVVEPAPLAAPQVIEELPARKVTMIRPGTYLYDFGQNLVGWVRLRARGAPGQRVVVRHGEMLNPDGTLYTSSLRAAAAVDTYWLRGQGEETLEPRFTFHGFRYVEVTGLEAAPPPRNVLGLVVHTPLVRTGDFASSDARVNQLFRNIVWGQKGNYLDVPTDCPQRDERLGWTGDTQFFARTAAYNFDVAAFLSRWLTTLVTDGQHANGSFPSIAPSIDDAIWPSTGWGDAALLVTYQLWQMYGDTRLIERHFPAFQRYLAFVDAGATDGIAKVGGFGDWLDKGGKAPAPVIDTAYHAHLCAIAADMAEAIGRPDEARRLREKSAAVRAAFQREFVLSDGRIKDSGQTGYALAFTMGLVPDDRRAAMTKQFVASVQERDWHLSTGFIGTPRLLPALRAAGRDDAAYRLLLQDTYPSWLYQVKLGATTMWERWDGWTPEQGFQSVDMNSFNHYAFGAVGEYLYGGVAGIETDGPGFRRILIRPAPGAGLTRAEASYDAVTGRIASSWRVDGNILRLTVSIPPNTRASIRVPTSDAASVRESRQLVQESPGVKLVSSEAGAVVYAVGSGTYRFESRYEMPARAE